MGYYKNKVRTKVDEQLEDSGRKYFDEIVKYTITGEFVSRSDSEGKLINDITYLLKKISLIEDAYIDEIIKLEDKIDNRSMRQSTIEESLGLESIEVK